MTLAGNGPKTPSLELGCIPHLARYLELTLWVSGLGFSKYPATDSPSLKVATWTKTSSGHFFFASVT